MSGGVAGAQLIMAAPYADLALRVNNGQTTVVHLLACCQTAILFGLTVV
jgi:hypothetical protein